MWKTIVTLSRQCEQGWIKNTNNNILCLGAPVRTVSQTPYRAAKLQRAFSWTMLLLLVFNQN